MKIDFREGMRRVGLLLGIIGAIAGGATAVADGQRDWGRYSAHRRFEALLAAPTMQRLTKTMKDPLRVVKSEPLPTDRNYQWDSTANHSVPPLPSYENYKLSHPDYGALAKQYGGTTTFTPPPVNSWQGPSGEIAVTEAELDERPDGIGGRYLQNAHPLLKGNTAGIDSVHLDASNSVTSIGMSSGETVERTAAPSVWALITPLFYPGIGFLIPWGLVCVAVWVICGFIPRP